jgi:V-type H+-transporting ATPase subunit d
MYSWEMLSFNIHDGFLEAIVRGNRSGLLTAADYNNLCQCETLDDIKMHLSATEYGPYLQNGTDSSHPARISTFIGVGFGVHAPVARAICVLLVAIRDS